VVVDRNDAGDADELRAIIRGDLTYEQVTQLSDRLVAEIDRAYDISPLPHHPDLPAINQLCIELVEKQGW
jgi:hypothetical protein